MSFYFLTFLLLAAGAAAVWFRPQYEEKVYWVCWSVMTACLCFRFGQGTDYSMYHALYRTIPPVIDLSKGYICGFYPETGWRLLCAAFKLFHAPFWVFTMALGLGEMLLLHRFLTKYVPMKTAGLFLLYPVLFLTYMLSGLRQGLVLCLFLGVLLPFYLEKKWVHYIIGVLLASSFHRVGYAWLVLPIAYYLPMWAMTALAGLSVLGGFVLQISAVQQFFVSLMPVYHLKQFLLEGDISVFATGERLISFAVLYTLYQWRKKTSGQEDRQMELLMKAYMCGVCFYMLMFGSAYYASRYGVIFKVLECALVAGMVLDRTCAAKLAAAFFFCLTVLMGCKNLNAMIPEGGYAEMGIYIWNFPYVSVFHQDKILDYMPYEAVVQKKYNDNIADQQLWMIEK